MSAKFDEEFQREYIRFHLSASQSVAIRRGHAMTITNICAIARYEGPDWLIDPEQDPWDDEPNEGDAEVIANLNDPESGATYRILDEDMVGWGQHTHIIRTTGDYGEYDYLATIVEEEPIA